MLSGSVGDQGQNRSDDVTRVQTLLRDAGCYQGPVTGTCDAATIAAIRQFQSRFLATPDGRIDVHGPTWRRLSGEPDPAQPTHHDVGNTQPTRRPIIGLTNEAITLWVTRDPKEVRFATRQGIPPARHAPYIFPTPADARPVPVTAPRPTPLVPGGFNRFTSDRVRYLDAIRTTLAQAGLHWDARVLMPLWANESGWDQHVYGYNVGNIKSQGTVYSPSFPDLISTRQVSVTVIESRAVMVFMDRGRSIDGYHAFSSAADYARYTARILSRYSGAIQALEHGGLEGAAGLAYALQHERTHHYSPASLEDAIAMFRGSYHRSGALIGRARYVR